MNDEFFRPIHFGFTWTDDGWYRFDHNAAHKAAFLARNARARQLRRSGKKVRMWMLKGQLVSQGGIGSGHPHIELVVTVYCLTAA